MQDSSWHLLLAVPAALAAGAAVHCWINTRPQALSSVILRRRLAMQRPCEAREKMLAGELYSAADPTLQELLQTAHTLCRQYNQCEEQAERDAVVDELLGGFPSGSRPYLESPFLCDYGCNIRVGANFYCNFNCVLLDCAEIKIGDNVFLGPGVQLYTANHPLDAVARRTVETAHPITIGDDVWIGGASVVIPGVTIGDRVVVAAGAVVTKDVPNDVLVGGCPAKILKHLNGTRPPPPSKPPNPFE